MNKQNFNNIVLNHPSIHVYFRQEVHRKNKNKIKLYTYTRKKEAKNLAYSNSIKPQYNLITGYRA